MSPLRRFLIDSKSQWGWLALLILALITAAMFEVSAPVLLGKVVDAIISGLQTNQDINTIFASIDTIILWLIAIYGGHALFTYFGEYMMASIGSKTVLALRTRMSTHLYSLPIEYFHDHQRGDLLSRLTSDLDAVAETIGHYRNHRRHCNDALDQSNFGNIHYRHHTDWYRMLNVAI